MSDLPISFACNNPDNGMFQGWFDAVTVGSEATLEGPRVSIRDLKDGRVRIGRLTFHHEGWREWVGNWCWDEIAVCDTLRLLEYLRYRNYQCIEGPTSFYNKWRDGYPLSLFSFDD